MRESKEIEYYDRTNNYHGIGTFQQLDDLPIKVGQLFIVPQQGNFAGCCEGRTGNAYLKPLLLKCKGIQDHHVLSENYGAWRKDLCFIEQD